MCRRPRELFELLLQQDTRPLAPPPRTVVLQPCVYEEARAPSNWRARAEAHGWTVTKVDSTPRAFRELGLNPDGHDSRCASDEIAHPLFTLEVPPRDMGRALRFLKSLGWNMDGQRILSRGRARELEARGILPTNIQLARAA